MALNLNPPPLQTGVDQQGRVSTPWHKWFAATQSVISGLIGSAGSQYINGVYAYAQSATNQTVLANTPTQISIDTVTASGITLASNQLTMSAAGIYQVRIAAQLTNTAANANEAWLWIRKNGADVAASAIESSVGAAHGGINGYAVASASTLLSLSAGDYLEFYWLADSTSVSLSAASASISPAFPAVPSFTASMTLVSSQG